MKTFLHSTTSLYWALLLLLLSIGHPTASLAQLASVQLKELSDPTTLRVKIWPLSNSPLLRVCYESLNYGSVRFLIRNEHGSVLYDDVLRASRYVGTFDLAGLPTGRYTIELQTPTAHHQEAIRVVQPMAAAVVSMMKEQAPALAAQ